MNKILSTKTKLGFKHSEKLFLSTEKLIQIFLKRFGTSLKIEQSADHFMTEQHCNSVLQR